MEKKIKEQKEIDLKEIVKEIWKYKFLVFVINIICLVFYYYSSLMKVEKQKITPPMFIGEIYIKVGGYLTTYNSLTSFHNSADLKLLIEKNFKKVIIEETSNYIWLTFKSQEKNIIEPKLNDVILFINGIEKQIASNYGIDKYIFSKVINDIDIREEFLSNKKTSNIFIIISSTITALIISLVLIYIINLIKNKEKN